jgi:regulator of sigma E protease
MLFTLIAFVVALGVLITFHELGHYWIARRCGVRVLRFSVGFGKVLARRFDRNGTEWAISAIPLGGYVKMLDEPEPNATAFEAAQAFNQKSLPQRAAIVAAGPIANLLLAALLYASLNMVGTQEPAPVLAQPANGTAAAAAGFEKGDRITAVQGSAVRSWGEARWELLDALTAGGRVDVQVDTGQGTPRERVLVLPKAVIEPDGADPMADSGLALMTPRTKVVQVNPGSAGEQAGLLPDDIILQVGTLVEPSTAAMVDEIKKHPEQMVQLRVLRNGAPVSLAVVPQAQRDDQGQSIGRIGVMLGADFPVITVSYGPFDSLVKGVQRTVDTAWLSLRMMGRMLVGDVSLRNVSGPVTIADYAGQTARIGLASYIAFMALISVSIGVLNLLPIPMLDGGHLMYYLFEAVRGRPVSDRAMERGQRIGLALLAGLMSLAFFNDLTRLFS